MISRVRLIWSVWSKTRKKVGMKNNFMYSLKIVIWELSVKKMNLYYMKQIWSHHKILCCLTQWFKKALKFQLSTIRKVTGIIYSRNGSIKDSSQLDTTMTQMTWMQLMPYRMNLQTDHFLWHKVFSQTETTLSWNSKQDWRDSISCARERDKNCQSLSTKMNNYNPKQRRE